MARLSRRHLLAGLAGAGTLAGGAVVSGRLRERDTTLEHRETIDGGGRDPDAWNEMHVDMVALRHVTVEDDAFVGVERGLAHLADVLGDWFGGYRLRTFETGFDLRCRGSQTDQLEAFLERERGGEGTNRQLHVVHSCTGYLSTSSCTSCRRQRGTGWGSAHPAGYTISTVSRYNKLYLPRRYRVRAFHHLLHGFLTGDAAREAAGLPASTSDYDAEHRLGTIVEGRRTVMADRYSYRHDAAAHGDCSSDADPRWSRWPDDGRLQLSPCTLSALELAATAERDA